jgi:UDP-glucose 4-epimerase
MKILITGINGFIGRHLGRCLASKHDVFGVTRLAHPQELSFATKVKLISADLSDPGFVDQLPSDIDCVIHLAQSQQYRNFPEGAEDMRRINIDATCHLLDWARKTAVKQFIFSSTANVYGKSTAQLTESDATIPESFYGATKLAAEHLVRQYKDFYQVDILRLFTVYGPGQKGMLIPNIADRIEQGLPVTLAQGVGLYLTPIYVVDVVSVIEKLIEKSEKNSCRLFNVCGDEVIDLSAIVKILEEVIGVKAHTQFMESIAPNFTGTNEQLKCFIENTAFTDIATGLAISFKNLSMNDNQRENHGI